MSEKSTVLQVTLGAAGYEAHVAGDTRTVMLALGHLCTEICSAHHIAPDDLGARVAGQVHIIRTIKEQQQFGSQD